MTDANNIFCGNLNVPNDHRRQGCSAGSVTLSMTGTTVTKTGAVLNSVVNFTATVPVVFMKVLGYQTLTISGVSKATASLPPYLDFYLMLDVSGSMGLPSTNAEQTRLAAVNPDDFTVYPNGCTFACHFQSSGSCTDPATHQTTNASGSVNQAYPTNNYCLGYLISRVSQTAYNALLQTTSNYPMKGKQLPSSIVTNGLTSSLTGSNSLLTGNSASQTNSLTPVDILSNRGHRCLHPVARRRGRNGLERHAGRERSERIVRDGQ